MNLKSLLSEIILVQCREPEFKVLETDTFELHFNDTHTLVIKIRPYVLITQSEDKAEESFTNEVKLHYHCFSRVIFAIIISRDLSR